MELAFGRFGQADPQAPQSLGSLAVFTSHPSAVTPSQSANPLLQAIPQAPAEQFGVESASRGQTVPHDPQLLTSVASLAPPQLGPASVLEDPASVPEDPASVPAATTLTD